ncbi:hypothetical protein D4A92_17800 [Rhizobium rosettiformans]|uniref:Uncharacterized protein n=1 Tax=Rhizobium rosettiformans TaxID=1368430 RepID=A0ABX7F0H3_9HYPH|nr:hypothetical protein [Rhizobium rosettiformans]QRF53161.1 hypothetical protein D4A92_17800 [Rhizobium rosettiformans]
MPNRQIAESPAPEPLELRLLRDILDEHRTPLLCPRRQCRRSRHCSGTAHRPADPINADEWLPPCALRAAPELRRRFLTWAADILPPLADRTAPGTWPDDREAANHLRQALAIVERIHTRLGPHPQSERTALTAWYATDPEPETTALCRRMWRNTKMLKRPRTNSGAAPSSGIPLSCDRT